MVSSILPQLFWPRDWKLSEMIETELGLGDTWVRGQFLALDGVTLILILTVKSLDVTFHVSLSIEAPIANIIRLAFFHL